MQETEMLGEKRAQEPLCPLQMPQPELSRDIRDESRRLTI
jgi:hypothetical protein